MDEENTRLGDFIKKQLETKPFEDDVWLRPDKEVRNHLLNQIITPKATSNSRRTSSIWKITAVAALLLLVAGSVYLYLKNQKLYRALQEREKMTEGFNRANRLLHENVIALQDDNNKRTQEQNRINHELNLLTQKLSKTHSENNYYTNKLTQSSQLNEVLAKENEELRINNSSYKKENEQLKIMIALVEASKREKNTSGINFMTIEQLNKLPQVTLALLPEAEINKVKTPYIKKREKNNSNRKIEVGYTYFRKPFQLSSRHEFALQRKTSDNLYHRTHSSSVYGIQLGYSLTNKLSLNAGLGVSTLSADQNRRIALKYNKSREVREMDGKFRNTFSLTSRSTFGSAQSDVVIRMNSTDEIQEGELVEGAVMEKFKYSYFQVPISATYFLGDSKLKYVIQGGLTYNHVKLKSYTLNATFTRRDSPVQVAVSDRANRLSASRAFIGLTGGLGLDYEIVRGWHGRFQLSYQYDMHKNNVLNERNRGTTSMNIGLHYHIKI